jgi:hypothetical protein
VTHSSVRECQQRIDAREFQEWIEYYKQEPFGDDWAQTALLAAVLVNLWSKKKVKPDQFIPRVAKVRQTLEQMREAFEHFVAVHNSLVNKEK